MGESPLLWHPQAMGGIASGTLRKRLYFLAPIRVIYSYFGTQYTDTREGLRILIKF
jgi:hypothetical protein